MKFKTRRGQFQIIAAFWVLTILTTAMIAAYNHIQDNEFKTPVILSSEMKEVNMALQKLLGFTSGYYGSMIKLTGNVTYAREKTNSYLEGGLETIAHSYVEKSVSFKLRNLTVSTNWFGKHGVTLARLTTEYSIPSLGLYGVLYSGASSLNATILETVSGRARIKVIGDNNEPNLSLTRESFTFLRYDDTLKTWLYIPIIYDPIISSSGIYTVSLPPGVSTDTYYLEVQDQRGIKASCGYVRGLGTLNKEEILYTYSFNWNQTIHKDLNDPYLEIELLQNGTLRWLGQNIGLSGAEKPIPPIPVKGIRLNQTIDGVNQQVPFQVEDWGGDYQVPFGLTSNTTIFNKNCMLVFLVNHHVSNVTLWWDGSDEAKQTSYSYKCLYFTGDNPSGNKLDNGVITLDLSNFASGAKSSTKTIAIDSTSTFLRVNGKSPIYGSAVSYVIHHGIVRDVIQQEPEWSQGISNSPDLYGHIVLTLPAKTSYYTYRVRAIFVETTLTRNLSELSVIQVKSAAGYAPLTEDGLQTNGLPKTSPGSLFYNGGTAYQHQWSEYVTQNRGIGLIMRPLHNQLLYTFDDLIGQRTGAISIDTANNKIELNPIKRYPVNGYQRSLDRTWVGAVVNFNTGIAADTIYPTLGGSTGLWAIVELPPTLTVS